MPGGYEDLGEELDGGGEEMANVADDDQEEDEDNLGHDDVVGDEEEEVEDLAELELPRLGAALTTHQTTVSSATQTLGLR